MVSTEIEGIGIQAFGGTPAISGRGEKLPLDPSGIPLPPENLVITITGNDVSLQWDPVTLDTNLFPITVDGYSIYLKTNPYGTYTYHDTTTQTQYSHIGVLNYQQKLFYRVRAIKNTVR
ncbi:MAG: hypothetical protein ACP5F3_00170 [Candidatus Syntrophosphaera sp.]